MKKQLLLFLFAIVASVGTMFASTKIGDLYYNLDATNQTAEVTYQLYNSANNYSGLTTATIPTSVSYQSVTYNVTSIGDSAFTSTNSSLTSVTIPNSITSIGENAFKNCKLTSITIPNSVTSIGLRAFSGMDYYFGSMSVEAGNPVYDSRENCNAIIETATNTLIAGCQHTIIPNSVTSIGEYAFEGISYLKSIIIPNSVTSIGLRAFQFCWSLSSVTCQSIIPPVMAGNDFANLNNEAISLYVPEESVSAYETSSGWKSLRNNLYTEKAEIGNIFYNLNKVTQIASVTYKGVIEYEYENEYTGDLIIPASIDYGGTTYNVTSIARRTFTNCELTSVIIPNSITKIGSEAFGNCTNLTYITCEAITPPRFGTGKIAFGHVDMSIPLYVPAKSVDLYKAADQWKDFTNILPIKCFLASGTCGAEGDNLTWELSCDGVLTISGTGDMGDDAPWLSDYKEQINVVIIADGVTSIGHSAFNGCSGLTSVTIPNSVTSIGGYAFRDCSSLTSIEIPNSVTSIEEYAFSGCSSLTSIEIPNSVTSIGKMAFYMCNALSSINIPNSVTNIADNVFQGSNLPIIDNIRYADTYLVAVVDHSLPSYTIKEGTKWIAGSAFQSCNSLTSLTIPNDVISIGSWAFSNCINLTSLTIPSSVNSIGNAAFNGCSNISTITCYSTNPPTLTGGENRVFRDINKSIPLYVPAESIDLYKAAKQWKDFTNILPISGMDIDHPTNPGTYQLTLNMSIDDAGVVTGAGMYAQGTEVSVSAAANTGYTFERWSDGVTDASRTITMIARDSTLTAIFSINRYTITFVDEDGTTVLSSDEYDYGATPVAPANPTKAATAQYTYTFNGWSPAIANVTGTATYTATYSQTVNKYTITFVDEDGTTVLSSDEYEYGATPVAPADPTKAATAQYTYTFTGWSPAIANVTGTATYTATYSQTVNKYTITFVDEDGTTVLASAEYEYGATPVAPADPTKAATEEYTYTFSGWDKTIVVVTEAATYTATYSSQLNNVAVTGDQDLADLPVGENTHITVGEDGNLTVSEPTTIGTITVTVNGDEASEIIGVENLTVTNAEMILRLEPNKANATPNKWYAFGVPFEVEVSGGIYAQGSASPAICNSAFVLDEYDGSLRASTQQGWKRVSSSAVLQPGVLYMIAIGSTTNEWRFVKRASASLTEQTSLSVAAYPSAIGAHHAGWNGLANTLFRDASVTLDGVQYITTYNNEQSVYEVQPIADATLVMAKPFFVQVPQAGTLYLAAQPAGVAARSLMAADEQSPSCVLSLSSADFTDRAYITVQVGKQNAYSIGHDLVKVLSGTPSVPQLWLEGYNMHLAAYELALASESTTFIIPLGLYAPQNGTYTLDADTQSDYYTLTLLADDTPVVELGEQAVSIELEQGNNSKYALRITKKADVVTDIANGTADGIQVVKFVQDDLLYILRDGKTYSIQGVEVK